MKGAASNNLSRRSSGMHKPMPLEIGLPTVASIADPSVDRFSDVVGESLWIEPLLLLSGASLSQYKLSRLSLALPMPSQRQMPQDTVSLLPIEMSSMGRGEVLDSQMFE